jgi:hypothetical protein
MLASLANYTRTHPRKSTFGVISNSLSLGAQVVKTSKKSRARRRWKEARDMYRQSSGCPTRYNRDYKTTLRSGKIVTSGKTNITYYECGIKGHYSNECPKKLNVAPKSTTCPWNHVITEDRGKGHYSLNIHNKKEATFPSNLDNSSNLKTRRKEQQESATKYPRSCS